MTPNSLKVIYPLDGETIENSLTAILKWQYPYKEDKNPYYSINLKVSQNSDMSDPLVDVPLKDHQTFYQLAVLPETTYYWEITPSDSPDLVTKAVFKTGKPDINLSADDSIRYKNPRIGSHWLYMDCQEFDEYEPLSPWYDIKSYLTSPPPTLEDIKEKLPVPILDGHPEVLEAYWYCWKTLLSVWYFSPESSDHQAVSNICGIKSWGPWGSTMVWDTAFILHFARYGHQAYPFITALDNCYARQHENGYICRETDKNNREVYVIFPVNPPLFAWAEWEYYLISGDRERLGRVFLPMIKHYEWWMTYQRRENGLYWTDTFQEADDSPRNSLVYYAASANSYQALTALCLSKIAHEIGRNDMETFFKDEHEKIGAMVNKYFWDEEHKIYNDLTADGKFITELKPDVFCKHAHMFWPLLAEIATDERAEAMAQELRNPDSFYRRNGVPCLSADSEGYLGGPEGTGQYWRGAVWPPTQCMVQEGLKNYNQAELLYDLAEKYFNVTVEVFKKEGTIKENLAPDCPIGYGASEFVGWGGIGPVANLIEYILGFHIDTPNNTISWHITRTERHGIKNLKLGDFFVDLICEERASPQKPCAITVNSSGKFKLNIVINGKTISKNITEGNVQYHCPEG
jgi:hypothetical protein